MLAPATPGPLGTDISDAEAPGTKVPEAGTPGAELLRAGTLAGALLGQTTTTPVVVEVAVMVEYVMDKAVE